MIDQVWRRLQLIVAQGKVLLVGSEKVQARVLDDEVLANLDRVEPYGYSYRPMPGAEVYLVFPAGDRSHGIALVIGDRRYQMDLAEGEVALHDDEGNRVHLRRGGVIECRASSKVVAETPLFVASGNAEIVGNLTVGGRTISAGGYWGDHGGAAELSQGAHVTGAFNVNGRDVSDTHTHTSSAPGTPTSEVI